jgi:hypothetical protein
MPRHKDDRTPKEEGQTSDEETEFEYAVWQRGGESPVKSPPPAPRKPRPRREPDEHLRDRRVEKKSDILYFENQDHQWVKNSPYYIRLGRKPSVLHQNVDAHWQIQKTLWNVDYRE